MKNNKSVICPLCKKNEVIFNFFENNHSLYSCKSCDLCFIYPYKQKDGDHNPLPAEKQLKSEKKAIESYLDSISSYLENKTSILDIGCGCGEFLKKAKKFGFSKRVGIEYDIDRAEFARENADCLVIDNRKDMEEIKNKFAVISLINVFSHITDLLSFFNMLENLVEENGVIIIKTGLIERPFKQKVIFDWQIPEHIHFLGNKTPEFLADKFNYEIVEMVKKPISKEIFSKEYFLSPGRSNLKNLIKRAIIKVPYSLRMIRYLYDFYTNKKFFTVILILKKRKLNVDLKVMS